MAKQIKVREDNYFAVQGWMVTELKLKGNALMLYAIIYGFSQTTNTAFTGSVDYLCEWLGGVSRPTVINTLDNLDEGRGLYIWGKSTGNGKTSWACKIMSYFFRKIAFNTGLENEGLYIFLPTFLEDLRDNYDNKDPEFDEILRMIKTCRLLIIDDIGAERVTDWVRERMVSIINTRVSNNLTTIYTSNLSPEELRGELGDRIASRVLGSSQVVEITSGDRRGL